MSIFKWFRKKESADVETQRLYRKVLEELESSVDHVMEEHNIAMLDPGFDWGDLTVKNNGS